jgi:hypothetical protein
VIDKDPIRLDFICSSAYRLRNDYIKAFCCVYVTKVL